MQICIWYSCTPWWRHHVRILSYHWWQCYYFLSSWALQVWWREDGNSERFYWQSSSNQLPRTTDHVTCKASFHLELWMLVHALWNHRCGDSLTQPHRQDQNSDWNQEYHCKLRGSISAKSWRVQTRWITISNRSKYLKSITIPSISRVTKHGLAQHRLNPVLSKKHSLRFYPGSFCHWTMAQCHHSCM